MVNILKKYGADLGMIYLMFVWGLHYIIVKDAIKHFDPMTFNAIRFLLGAGVLIPIAFFYRKQLAEWSWIDLRRIILMTLMGAVIYQILFINSLHYTTATNAALLSATMPIWTAIISVILGNVTLRRGLVISLGVTFIGVALVILSRGEETQLSFSGKALFGDLLALMAAVILGTYWIFSKPFIDKYGSMSNAIYKHWTTALGLTLVASPNLIHLQPSDVPSNIVPNIVFSGLIAGISGYMISNYAIGKLGAARTSTYNNLSPIITAIGGVIFLEEPITGGLIVGAGLTLMGVAAVRKYMHSRHTATPKFIFRRRIVVSATAVGD